MLGQLDIYVGKYETVFTPTTFKNQSTPAASDWERQNYKPVKITE